MVANVDVGNGLMKADDVEIWCIRKRKMEHSNDDRAWVFLDADDDAMLL